MDIMIDLGKFWTPLECPTCHQINWIEMDESHIEESDVDQVICCHCGETHWLDDVAKDYAEVLDDAEEPVVVHGWPQPVALTEDNQQEMDELSHTIHQVFNIEDFRK